MYDVLYADDALVHVEEMAQAIEKAGEVYGMNLHWGKMQALSACTQARLRRPDGTVIEETGFLTYLGSVIVGDGRADSEILRRLVPLWGTSTLCRSCGAIQT